MADGGRHSYVFDAFGLILLYAVAMVAIAIPFRSITQTNHQIADPIQVNANESGK